MIGDGCEGLGVEKRGCRGWEGLYATLDSLGMN